MWSCLPPIKRWILSLPWNLIGSYVWCWQTEWSRQDIVWPLGLVASTFTPLKPWVMMYRSPTLPGETMWIERPPPPPRVIAAIAVKHHMTKTILDHPAPSSAEPSEDVNSRSDHRWDQKNNPLHTAESGKNKWFLCSRHNGYGSFYVFGLYEHNGKKNLCHVKAPRRWRIEWLLAVCSTLCYYTYLSAVAAAKSLNHVQLCASP